MDAINHKVSVARTSKREGLAFSSGLLWIGILICAILIAYVSTISDLIDGPWQTEQEGHGPLIIAASLWFVWQSRERLKMTESRPAPVLGWAILLVGLVLMFLARIQQGVLGPEFASLILVITGSVFIGGGWPVFRVLAFPIGFLVFAIPMPDWLIDGLTVPLKVFISDAVTRLLYALGFPVAQNGVMIMIGSYQLLVKDACSGMNSIFALSAIGVFYAYAFRWNEKFRSLLLLAAIVPITIVANFLRVLALVLMAYYAGPDIIEGIVHDLTGISLFIIALVLMFLFDAFLGVCFHLVRRSSRRVDPASSG